jgi:hypothetical protein
MRRRNRPRVPFELVDAEEFGAERLLDCAPGERQSTVRSAPCEDQPRKLFSCARHMHRQVPPSDQVIAAEFAVPILEAGGQFEHLPILGESYRENPGRA